MILFDLANSENHPAYQKFQIENGSRQFDFLRSTVEAALAVEMPFLSQTVLKALNHHAIVCLHPSAGQYRPCEVTAGTHVPPPVWQVPGLMDDFTNTVNRRWHETDPITLAAYVLWRLNNIHPFINGNGRTARAASYFTLCVKLGGWLPGSPILPALITRDRDEYVGILERTHASHQSGNLNLNELKEFVARRIQEQIASAKGEAN